MFIASLTSVGIYSVL